MAPDIQLLGESFIYACTSGKAYTYEQFVPEHLLAYQISGQTHIFHQRGEMVLEAGQVLLAHRNQFAKSIKMPAEDDTSPSNWLKSKRLSEAYYLIKQKNQKPANIYLDLGFENLSHFYTSFKQKYGVTPAQINLDTNTGVLQTKTI